MIFTASQQPVFKQVKENYECIYDVLENTKDSDWVLTPEGSLSGYCEGPVHNATQETKDEYNDYEHKLENYLKENRRNLALGTGHIEQDKLPYNEIRFYREGNFQKYYAKQLLTHGPEFMGEYHFYVPGVKLEVIDLCDISTSKPEECINTLQSLKWKVALWVNKVLEEVSSTTQS